MVKNWFQCRQYSFSDVLGIQARLQVELSLEESYELIVLLKGGKILFLDVGNESHMSFVRTVANMSEERLANALDNIFHKHLTE